MKNKLFWLIIVVFTTIPALMGIIHAGFFVSDDGHWMIIRLSSFYEALVSGQFPVRFLPRLNQGIGYPVADFLYPLFLYLGSFLHLVKIPFVLDVKILLIGSMVASALGTYIWLKQLYKPLSAFVGAIVFVYAPYHLYDLYSRGSVGEILSLGILPFVLWSVEKKQMFFASILFALLILAHNTLALFFLPVVILYACIRKISWKQIGSFILFSLGLSLFFLASCTFR